jgi:3',5'-cyclic AMP phosphodiesterase CpdA
MLCLMLLACTFGQVGAHAPLIFRADGTFTIVQFTDLHLTPASITQTQAILNAVLDAEKPDFVAYTGDICESSTGSCKEAANHSAVFRDAFSVNEDRGIPWAITYGNWDRNPDAFMTGQQNNEFIMKNFAHSRNKKAPDNVKGDSVFDVPIFLPNTTDTVDGPPAAVLYFLDTHMNDGCEGKSGTGCIYASEVAWYNATSDAYRKKNGGKAVPAMAFFHIPLPEHMLVWNQGEDTYGRLDEPAGDNGAGVGCVIDSNGFFRRCCGSW